MAVRVITPNAVSHDGLLGARVDTSIEWYMRPYIRVAFMYSARSQVCSAGIIAYPSYFIPENVSSARLLLLTSVLTRPILYTRVYLQPTSSFSHLSGLSKLIFQDRLLTFLIWLTQMHAEIRIFILDFVFIKRWARDRQGKAAVVRKYDI